MDVESIDQVLRQVADDVERDHPVWVMHRGGVRMSLIVDTRFDRMRIVAPIKSAFELTQDQQRAVLEANFHTALDARYASSDGILYAAYIHPLSPLTTSQLRSAVSQVAMIVRTFGTTYSSGALMFGQRSRSGSVH